MRRSHILNNTRTEKETASSSQRKQQTRRDRERTRGSECFVRAWIHVITEKNWKAKRKWNSVSDELWHEWKWRKHLKCKWILKMKTWERNDDEWELSSLFLPLCMRAPPPVVTAVLRVGVRVRDEMNENIYALYIRREFIEWRSVATQNHEYRISRII